MARNPMADSLVQSVWLQMARNPMEDTLVKKICLLYTSDAADE